MEVKLISRCEGDGWGYYAVKEWGKYGNTLKDILKEIKEYTQNDKQFRYFGDGFGCKESNCNNAWSIVIETETETKIYKSCWADKDLWEKYDGDESEVVKSIYGGGGWYCAIDFHIVVNKFN